MPSISLPSAELLNVGKQSPAYAIVLHHVPPAAQYAVLAIRDFDTPSCRARAVGGGLEIQDSFVKRLVDKGIPLGSIQQGACPFIHLLMTDVPVRGESLRLDLDHMERIGVSGDHSAGGRGFFPPTPPEEDPAIHRYQLQVVFTKQPLSLNPGFSAQDLDRALKNLNSGLIAGQCQAELSLTAAELKAHRGL